MKRGPTVVTLVLLVAVAAAFGIVTLANRSDGGRAGGAGDSGPTSSVGTARPTPSGGPTSTTMFTGTPGAPPANVLQFAVPADARFVAERGSDSADGSASTPWRTIQHAIDESPDRATIVVHGGVYREALVIRHKTLTLQSFPHESVFVRGSDPIAPQPDGSGAWRVDGWDAHFARQHADWTTPDAPMANAPDLVFVDGRSLRQVADRAAVRDGSFFVDANARTLIIGSDPAGHTVEAARRATGLLLSDAPSSVVRGITFDRFATPLDNIAAVVDKSSGVTFDSDVFADNATGGLSVLAPDAVVQHCSMLRNGQLGLHAYQANRMVVTGTVLDSNNTEHFSTHVQAGGTKVSDSDAVTIRDSVASANVGDGMWFDVGDRHVVVARNSLRSNAGNGIEFEISSDGIIAANLAVDNVGNGVRVLESQRVDVVNNTFVRNTRGIDVLEGGRRQNVDLVRLIDNVFFDGRNGSTSLLAVDDVAHQRSAAAMRVRCDGNVYLRSQRALPPYVVIWSEAPRDAGRFANLRAFSAATAQEAHGVADDNVAATSVFRNAPAGDYALAASALLRAAVPLDATLRDAITAAGVVAPNGVGAFG